jgi:DNA-binding transcriptional regulator YhcF (GntR family)
MSGQKYEIDIMNDVIRFNENKKVYKIGTFLKELQSQMNTMNTNHEVNQLFDELVSTIISELRTYGYNGYQIYEWFKQRINNVENLKLR